MRTTKLSVLVVLLVLFWSVTSSASPAWYSGQIERIYLVSGGFIVTMSNTALDGCQHGYVYFYDSVSGEKKIDRVYSMALAAQASGKTFGVVIDKSINGVGGRCDATGDVDIKD